MYLILFIIAVVTYKLIKFQNAKPDPEKIFGIYSQPGKWYYLKYVVFYLFYRVRQIAKTLNPKKINIKYGDATITNVEDLEKPQTLSNHPKAFDATFFHAVNHEGFYICGGIERRQNKKINGVFYLVVPELGLLRHPVMPETLMETSDETIHHGGGIKFVCEKPMQRWRLQYNGLMTLEDDPTKSVQVDLDCVWTAEKFLYFVIETDLSAKLIADAIAREPWSREFFNNLREAHQTHYEQMGMMEGEISVDGNVHKVMLDSFRDHSFGQQRDWSLMHRYIFHMAYLENGTRICVGVISQPCTTSQLVVGYVAHTDGKCSAIDSCDLQLFQHAEFAAKPGKDIAFTVTTAAGELYTIRAFALHESVHYKGSDNESMLIERFIKYDVNAGISGRGISEWQYNVGTLNKVRF